MVNFVELNRRLLDWLRGRLAEYDGDAGTLSDALKELAERGVPLMLEKGDGGGAGAVGGNAALKAGDLSIDLRRRTVTKNGENIFLTPKEFDILYFLFENRGEVFTKEQIYSAVWKEGYLLSDSNIMAFIRRLRTKIEDEPDNPAYILTIWGVGYKFNDRL